MHIQVLYNDHDYHALQSDPNVGDILISGFYAEQWHTAGIFEALHQTGVGPGMNHVQIGSLDCRLSLVR